MHRTPSLWRHGEFMRLWLAQTISVFGSGFTQLALPLIAATTLGATPAQMGSLNAVQFAPFLLLGLFVGVWVDRLPRRSVLIASDAGRAVLVAMIPLAAFGGILAMPHLYVIGFLVGVLTVFFEIAYQAYLPTLVTRTQLVEGNSKLEGTRSLAQVASPGVAGVIIEMVSASAAIALNALSFLVSALFIGAIRRREPALEHAARRPMWAEIREGLGVVFGHRVLRSIAGCGATSNFFFSAVGALFILFVTRTLGLSAGAIGLVLALGNLGSVAGAILAAPVARRIGTGPAIVAGSLLAGFAVAPIVLATPGSALPILIAMQAVVSLANVVYNVNQVSLRQTITPLRLQGRVNATMRFVVWGTMPLGSLAGGLAGELLGLRGGIAVGAAGASLAFLWVLLSPVRSLRVPPESEA